MASFNSYSTTKLKPNEKRKRVDIFDSDSNKGYIKYLIMESKDQNQQDLTTISPFKIYRGIQNIVGDEINKLTKLRNGMLLIETKNEEQTKKLLSATLLEDIPIECTKHRTMNTCKAVIKCRDLRDVDDVEITKELAEQGVTNSQHITVRRNDQIQNTNTIILTFDRIIAPIAIKVGYLNVKTEPYIPNPLRCFHCQKFGHHGKRCRRHQPVCARCAQIGHTSVNCPEENPIKCANCDQQHTSYDKNCPKWAIEKKVVAAKYTNNITFKQARELVCPSATNRPSYLSLLTRKKEASTQTDTSQLVKDSTTNLQKQKEVLLKPLSKPHISKPKTSPKPNVQLHKSETRRQHGIPKNKQNLDVEFDDEEQEMVFSDSLTTIPDKSHPGWWDPSLQSDPI
jgi:hypothetical protein